MPICQRLKSFLDANSVPYEIIPHARTYTAQGTAASAQISGQELVKSVMVSGDGEHTLVATTANRRINLEKLRKVLELDEVHLEREDEFMDLFKDCEPGAMPPFGNLYGIPMVVDESVYEDEEIAFNAGDHASLIKINLADFKRLVKPRIAAVADLS